MYYMCKDLPSTQPINNMYHMCKDLQLTNYMYYTCMCKDLPLTRPIRITIANDPVRIEPLNSRCGVQRSTYSLGHRFSMITVLPQEKEQPGLSILCTLKFVIIVYFLDPMYIKQTIDVT